MRPQKMGRGAVTKKISAGTGLLFKGSGSLRPVTDYRSEGYAVGGQKRFRRWRGQTGRQAREARGQTGSCQKSGIKNEAAGEMVPDAKRWFIRSSVRFVILPSGSFFAWRVCLAARAQTDLPGAGLLMTRSVSGQFIVSAAEQKFSAVLPPRFSRPTPISSALSQTLLAIAAERFGDLLWQQLALKPGSP